MQIYFEIQGKPENENRILPYVADLFVNWLLKITRTALKNKKYHKAMKGIIFSLMSGQ